MHLRTITLVLCFWFAFPLMALAVDFTGTWTLDIRSKAERKQGIECGFATFDLKQSGEKIIGEHTFATPGCGRINEGGEGTVKGTITGKIATLEVTSGRNGAVVRGKATLQGHSLNWVTIEEIKAGEPEGDSPLILDKGILTLVRSK
jgi:hypothetical protein